jgi:hypothetical protein
MMKWRRFGRNCCYLIKVTFQFLLEGTEERHETSVKIADVLATI